MKRSIIAAVLVAVLYGPRDDGGDDAKSITYLLSGGGTVQLLPGTYRVCSSIEIGSSSHLMGPGLAGLMVSDGCEKLGFSPHD